MRYVPNLINLLKYKVINNNTKFTNTYYIYNKKDYLKIIFLDLLDAQMCPKHYQLTVFYICVIRSTYNCQSI